MANKYFWNDVDVSDITGVTSSHDYKNSSNNTIFKSFPGVKNTSLNDYEKYTSYDTNPPFYDNNTTIFRNIKVSSTIKTKSGTSFTTETTTITKPSWANAFKIYIEGSKGFAGSNASGHSSYTGQAWTRQNNNYNHNHNRNNHNNRTGNRRHNDRNRWNNENIRLNWHDDYAAASGKSGGTGGNSQIYSTAKAYAINNSDSIVTTMHSNHVKLHVTRSGSTIAQLKINCGSNGTNATASSTTDNRTVINQTMDKPVDGWGSNPANMDASDYNALDNWYKDRVPVNWNENNVTVNQAVAGTNGSNGTIVSASTIAFNSYYYTTGNNTSNTTRTIGIYWFKI